MTIRFTLKQNKKNSKGMMPIYLVITQDGKQRFKSTGHYVLPAQWNDRAQVVKPANLLSEEINNDLLVLKKSALSTVTELKVKKMPVNSEIIKTAVSGGRKDNIFDFADNYRKGMTRKRDPATLENVRKHIAKLELYHGSRELNFQDITAAYLNKYETWLIEEDKKNPNYAFLLMRTIRRMFQEAKKQKIIENYPFGEGYEMLTYTPPDKQYFTADELQVVKDHEPEGKSLITAKVWAIFGCHSGLRVSDWHRFSANPKEFVKQGRLHLHPKKKSTGFVSMPIMPDLAAAIEQCKAVPFYPKETPGSAESYFNEDIKKLAKECKIKKHLTAHSMRHHFAIVQCLEKKISSETGAELMGITLQTFVDNYSVVTDLKIDQETKEAWG